MICAPPQEDSEDDDRKERDKQERIEASIKKREEEVQRTLSTSLRERDKEREQHKKDEAIQHFNALLADLVSLQKWCSCVALFLFYYRLLLRRCLNVSSQVF